MFVCRVHQSHDTSFFGSGRSARPSPIRPYLRQKQLLAESVRASVRLYGNCPVLDAARVHQRHAGLLMSGTHWLAAQP